MNVEVLKHASGARHCHSLYQQVIGVQTLNQSGQLVCYLLGYRVS